MQGLFCPGKTFPRVPDREFRQSAHLNTSWIHRIAQSRYMWAALGGVSLAAAFPNVGMAGLAWIAPGWILFSALGGRGGESFRIGFVGGLAYALTAFYWLLL